MVEQKYRRGGDPPGLASPCFRVNETIWESRAREKFRGGSVYFEGGSSLGGGQTGEQYRTSAVRTSDGGVQAAEVSCSFALPWELRFSVPGQKIKLCKSQKVEGEGSRWECGLDPPLLCSLG